MKRLAFLQCPGLAAITLLMTLSGCHDAQAPRGDDPRLTGGTERPLDNPLVVREGETPETPPFDRIEAGHLVPALEWALATAEADLERAASGPVIPTFDDTIEPLLRADARVGAVARLAMGLSAVGAWPGAAEQIDRLEHRLAEHQDRIYADRNLHGRIERLHERGADAELTPEQDRLLTEIRRRFRMAGAHLDADDRETLADIDRRLAALDREYRGRLMDATHESELLIIDPERLESLPESIIADARQNAADRGHPTGWAFTLHAHSFYPFMRHFPDRDARQALYRERMRRYRDLRRSDADLGRLIERLAEWRARRAALLGFKSHLDLMLANASLGERADLERLLEGLERSASPYARAELEQLEAIARRDGIDGPLQPWDWWYYRQRLDERSSRAAGEPTGLIDDRTILSGLFRLTGRLWGLQFLRRDDLPRWHDSVEAYEVRDASGDRLGLLYFDLFHRRGKRGGAWMSRFHPPQPATTRATRPIVSVVTNLPRQGRDEAGGLAPEDVRALFHEFGHALHALLSKTDYAALAGTNVAPDFVEFPALVFERLAFDPSIVAAYATDAGGNLPIDAARLAALAGQGRPTPGLELLETLAAARLDLALHGAAPGRVPSLDATEAGVRDRMELPDIVSARHHGGGLDSLFAQDRHGGDFRTLWSDLLAADAVEALRDDTGLSMPAADALRREILARGNSRPPLESWRAFSGSAPSVGPLLRSLGISPAGNVEKEPSAD